jgi:hypothetical protein
MDFGIFAMIHQYHGCWFTQGISSGAQYVTLRKKKFTSKFSYLLFCNPHPWEKLKLGQEKVAGLLIANHLN